MEAEPERAERRPERRAPCGGRRQHRREARRSRERNVRTEQEGGGGEREGADEEAVEDIGKGAADPERSPVAGAEEDGPEVPYRRSSEIAVVPPYTQAVEEASTAWTSGISPNRRSPARWSASMCLVSSSTGGCRPAHDSGPAKSAPTLSDAKVRARTSTSSSTSRRTVGRCRSSAPCQYAAYASASAAQAASGSSTYGRTNGWSSIPA